MRAGPGAAALACAALLSSGARAEELTVFAAASLREAFSDLAKTFEAQHPGVRVELDLAGSQELRVQIENGAAADVFASADERHMARLREQGLVEAPAVFARNEPVIVVPKDNPAGVGSLDELPRARHIVLGAPEVPIGAYAERILAAARLTAAVEPRIASRELNVRQVLAKVALGEADAGIVYRTDALAARGEVRVIAIPPGVNVIAQYPVAALSRSRHPALARAFVQLLLSPAGKAELARRGFSP